MRTDWIRRNRPLAAALAVAFVIRLAAPQLAGHPPAAGLEASYLTTVASMASGFGALSPPAWSGAEKLVIGAMQAREAAGGRIDPLHPFPQDARGWWPATGHPPGYGLLLLALYRAVNYTWMVRLVHLLQIALDAFTCLLVFATVSRLFGRRPALTAAWIYAILPPSVFLSLQMLPDALTCFFAAAILAAATRRSGLLTGVAIGVASQFRAEFVLWPALVLLPLALTSLRISQKLRFAAALLAAMFVILLPWMYWTKKSTGRVLLASTAGGGSLYETLGEDPANPWGIRLLDEWLDADAVKRGFASSWTADADLYYRAAFYDCVRRHPGAYLRLVAFHRLPLALVPPYMARPYAPAGRSVITEYRLKEGLSRWGVVWKHPGVVLTRMWDSSLMALVSALLLIGTVGAAVSCRTEWRGLAWLLVPWFSVIVSICLLKQVEARNMAANLPIQVAVTAVLVTRIRQRARIRIPLPAHAAARP